MLILDLLASARSNGRTAKAVASSSDWTDLVHSVPVAVCLRLRSEKATPYKVGSLGKTAIENVPRRQWLNLGVPTSPRTKLESVYTKRSKQLADSHGG